jgi:hypothetical protein
VTSPSFEVQADTDEVRITLWRLPPGSATGFHRHELDYVVVPLTNSELVVVGSDQGRTKASLTAEKSYFRKAGVEHDIVNESPDEIRFIEVELKPAPEI